MPSGPCRGKYRVSRRSQRQASRPARRRLAPSDRAADDHRDPAAIVRWRPEFTLGYDDIAASRYRAAMPAARSLIRIAVNVAIDGVLAAVAVPVAWWITDPPGAVPSAAFAIPLGAAALLLAGLPFRLSQQYWRFAGMGDLLTVTASSALGAVLFSLRAVGARTGATQHRLPAGAWPDAAGAARRAQGGVPLVPVARAEPGGAGGCHRRCWSSARPRIATCSCAHWAATGGSGSGSRACSRSATARPGGASRAIRFWAP